MSKEASLRQLLTLQSWTSAAFPTGAFSCSHGLETAIQHGNVHDLDSCHDWIHAIVTQGSGWNDSIIMAQAHRLSQSLVFDNAGSLSSAQADQPSLQALRELNDLALALQSGAERHAETTQLAAAFLASAAAWQAPETSHWHEPDEDVALAVACGWLGARHAIPVQLLIASTLQSMSSNLAWIATRLVPLGQTSCLQLIARLEPVIESVSLEASLATQDDLGSGTLLADLASLQHEQLAGRVCLT
ncbi:urease accessory protein UreF [Granulosicoccus sp. 3-233]|uniref:urease accessory protein UreF n=1 Tax=Granulosicoccus sp. 3-233 TaxID=3417969 RepID=UPI003D334641